MADLVAFFNAPWPQEAGSPGATVGADGTVVTVGLVVIGVVVAGVLVAGIRRGRRTAQPTA